ncbi:ankyrin repeat domain-containing protein [Endozoicomonas sp. ONNA2]|uniref:ankyrin repeat domain-containing protein n=1 Tax=Endozoicomonas sp. ONNA2 TaxID=2828741 RepID=UPI00214952AA
MIEIINSLVHFILYHETLASRAGKIENSRIKPQERIPFLSANVATIAKLFYGESVAANLFNFIDGCCFGITANYILFATSGELERFDKILSTLSQDPEEGWIFWGRYYSNLADAIVTAQDQFQKRPNTENPDTLLLLQMRPFCESLLLFQYPETTYFSSLIPYQDISATARLLASENLAGDAPFQSTPFYTAGLKPEGVKSLLLQMRTTEYSPERFFHISSGGHIIAMQVSNQGYEIFDQNIANYKKFFPINDEDKLADYFKDRMQQMPFDISLPFHNNSIFKIREFFSKSILAKGKTENKQLKEALKEIPDTQRCDVNEKNFNGFNQLHLAAWENDIEGIHRLLGSPDLAINSLGGANHIKVSQSLLSALHLACLKGSTGAFELLLKDVRCSPTLASSHNHTPLWFAASKGHKSILKALLEVTPENLNIPDVDGQSPLFIAAFHDHLDIVKVLMEYPDLKINQKRYDGATALHAACYAGNVKIVAQLITSKDIQIDSRNDDHETPIKVAAKNGHSNCVAVLLIHGVKYWQN